MDAAKEGTKDVDKASAEGGGGEANTDDAAAKKNDADTDMAEADKSGNTAPAATGGEETKHPREEDNKGGENDEDEPSAKKAKVAVDEQ